MPSNEVTRRVDELETKMDTVWDQVTRHIAGCEKLGIAAAESRDRMERNLVETRTRMEIIGSELTVKLDKLLARMSEQDGAVKAGKFLYAVLGVIVAGIIWAATHLGIVK